MTEAEVRSLTLKRGKFEKSTLYKVKKGWKVKFKFSPEFLPEDTLSLLINFPIEGASFIRDKYYDIYDKNGVEICMNVSGSFHYYVTRSKKCSESEDILCDGFICVDPDLPLNIDSLGTGCPRKMSHGDEGAYLSKEHFFWDTCYTKLLEILTCNLKIF